MFDANELTLFLLLAHKILGEHVPSWHIKGSTLSFLSKKNPFFSKIKECCSQIVMILFDTNRLLILYLQYYAKKKKKRFHSFISVIKECHKKQKLKYSGASSSQSVIGMVGGIPLFCEIKECHVITVSDSYV